MILSCFGFFVYLLHLFVTLICYTVSDHQSKETAEEQSNQLSGWKGLQSHFLGFGTPVNHVESHYPQIEET